MDCFVVDTHTQMGNTALALVALKDHASCIPLLIDAGADKDSKNKVRTDFRGRECLHAHIGFIFSRGGGC